MAALVATEHNSTIRTFSLSALTREKNKKVALVAGMKKLLTIMNCTSAQSLSQTQLVLWTQAVSNRPLTESYLH